jgi:hypothetical protein
VKFFWPTYALTAIAGSAAINFGAMKLAGCFAPSNGAVPPAPALYPDAPNARSSAPMPSLPAPEVVLAPEVAAPDALTVPVGQPAESLPVTPLSTPDASDGRAAVTEQRTGKWGVTTTQAACYSTKGSYLGPLAGGTIVAVQGSTSSSRGSMTICRYQQGGGAWQGPVLVSDAHLRCFDGSTADLPAGSLDALQRYFETKGLIDSRTAELTRQQVDANPHAVPYRQAYEKLMALQARAKALTAERDAATGMARERAIDELRQMKDDQSRLRQTFNQAQARYQDWKSQHAETRSANPAADQQIQAWERRLATLEPSVRNVLQSP